MRQFRVGRVGCWTLVLIFIAPLVLTGQTSQLQNDAPVLENKEQQNKEVVAIALQVIKRHESYKPRHHESTKRGYFSTLETLSGSLDSLAPDEQTLVLRAINYLTRDATAEVCIQAIKSHQSNQITDKVWVKTLMRSVELMPDRVNEVCLSALEAWQSTYPFVPKMSYPAREVMFEPTVFSRASPGFQLLASQSKNVFIAQVAQEAMISKDKEHQLLLRHSVIRNLASTTPMHRIYGLQLRSQLNPTWKGHQARLKQLTGDPDQRVAQAAIAIWFDTVPSDSRRLLDALLGDSEIEIIRVLNRIGSNVIGDWGSRDPIVNLVESGSVPVRTAAIKTIARIESYLIRPFTKAIETDPDDGVRQLALDCVQLRAWNPPSSNDNRWTLNSLSDHYYEILADAKRNGLATQNAMQRLTEPFGYHPKVLYESLGSGELREADKLKAIAQLLDSDPSLEATELAIISMRQIIAINQAKKQQGYLGQSSTALDLINRHAKRLAPILPELCAFIEQAHSTRLVEALPSFGLQGKPSLGLLSKILEDETGKWKNSRISAIVTVREMQHLGKPALPGLLKVAQDDDDTTSLQAALTYLDLGGDPAALMPKYALSLPVVVKIDAKLLVTIPEFTSALRSKVASDCPWDLLRWLGADSEFLMSELKLKYNKLMPTSNSRSGEIENVIELLPLIESAQKEFLPICIEHLTNEPGSMRCFTALETLSTIGDDQRLAETAVTSLMDTGTDRIRLAARACYEKIYKDPID